MKLGAHFLPEDFPVFVESVQAAERAGYERAWLVDGQMLWQDLYVYMTHALAATERIVVGSGVTNPLTRHPAVTASAHATLAQLHPDRVVLGIGRGDNAVRTLGHKPVPTAELAETVPRLRAWMAGTRPRARASAGRTSSVPIMLCATGPKNLRLAGALADIVMIYVGVHPASVRWAIEHVRAGAEEAGRDPDDGRDRRALRDARLGRPGGGVGAVPLGAGRVREPHRLRAEVEPAARHAGGDDAPRRRARRSTTTTPGTSTRRPSTRAT